MILSPKSILEAHLRWSWCRRGAAHAHWPRRDAGGYATKRRLTRRRIVAEFPMGMEAVTEETDRSAICRVSDFLVEEILNAPAQDIVAEIKEEDGDPDQFSIRMRERFEATLASLDRHTVAAVEVTSMEPTAEKSAKVIPLPVQSARKIDESAEAASTPFSERIVQESYPGNLGATPVVRATATTPPSSLRYIMRRALPIAAALAVGSGARRA